MLCWTDAMRKAWDSKVVHRKESEYRKVFSNRLNRRIASIGTECTSSLYGSTGHRDNNSTTCFISLFHKRKMPKIIISASACESTAKHATPRLGCCLGGTLGRSFASDVRLLLLLLLLSGGLIFDQFCRQKVSFVICRALSTLAIKEMDSLWSLKKTSSFFLRSEETSYRSDHAWTRKTKDRNGHCAENAILSFSQVGAEEKRSSVRCQLRIWACRTTRVLVNTPPQRKKTASSGQNRKQREANYIQYDKK